MHISFPRDLFSGTRIKCNHHRLNFNATTAPSLHFVAHRENIKKRREKLNQLILSHDLCKVLIIYLFEADLLVVWTRWRQQAELPAL